jgi:hypothetical protein
MPRFLLIAVALLFVATQPAFAARPRWAKKATAFRVACYQETRECNTVRIPAPDAKSSVEVLYRKDFGDSHYDWWLQAYLRVTTPGAGDREAALPDDFEAIDAELLWSPDSHAFFVNGSSSAISGSMYVYLANDPTEPRNITEEAQRDMLKDFPPCKAAFPNADDAGGCKKTSRDQVPNCEEGEANPKDNPDYNMIGIDWVNASTILVMGEVPCDSLFGGIMCQVMGYELEVPTGHILKRFDAKELKLKWQKSMEWKFRIPDPPLYCE